LLDPMAAGIDDTSEAVTAGDLRMVDGSLGIALTDSQRTGEPRRWPARQCFFLAISGKMYNFPETRQQLLLVAVHELTVTSVQKDPRLNTGHAIVRSNWMGG
jgi:hypothetical protein